MSKKHRMRFQDALDLVDDDLPDGAYFAMAEELSGMDLASGVDQMLHDQRQSAKPFRCEGCKRRFVSDLALAAHKQAKNH